MIIIHYMAYYLEHIYFYHYFGAVKFVTPFILTPTRRKFIQTVPLLMGLNQLEIPKKSLCSDQRVSKTFFTISSKTSLLEYM